MATAAFALEAQVCQTLSPGFSAPGSVGDGLIPGPTVWRGRCHLLWFQGLGTPSLAAKTPVTAAWWGQRQAEYDWAHRIVALIRLAALLMEA